MKTAPWFKLWAADYMMDRDIDGLSLEAQGLLLRIWCVMWIEGGIPKQPEEIARKCRVSVLHVHLHMQNLMQFLYEDASGLLMSERMEVERIKSKLTSKARSESAKFRWNNTLNAIAYAKVDANPHAKEHAKTMHSESEPESEKRTKAKAQAPFELPKSIPQEAWNGFEEMRKKIRKPMTDRARRMIVKELEELEKKGNPPGKVLDQSTMNDWQSVYELKAKTSANGHTPQPVIVTSDSPLLKTRDGRPFKVQE